MGLESRVVSERVLHRMEELRDLSVDDVKEKARQINHQVSRWDIRLMLNEGLQDFTKSVKEEFHAPLEVEFAELLLAGFRKYFFASKFLKGEVIEILGPFLISTGQKNLR